MDEQQFAEDTVRLAGEELLRLSALGFGTTVKGGNWKDIVTTVDVDVNAFIIKRLKETFSGDAIYSEEGGGGGSGIRLWVVDPIDGSSNFARGIPHFAVCVGLVENGAPQAGAIYNPVTHDLFSFTKGGGAFLNGTRIAVSGITNTKEGYALLTAGRRDDVREWGGESYKKLLANFQKTKNLGASALDIAFVASGRVEAVVYGTLTTEDIAPALGLLYEAGGVASLRDGSPVPLSKEAQRVYVANNEHILSFTRELLETP